MTGPARLLFTSPNPTRGDICIGYEQVREGVVSLEIVNVAGRRVTRVEGPARTPGLDDSDEHLLCWDGTGDDGREVSSGVYLAQLLFNGQRLNGERAPLTVVR